MTQRKKNKKASQVRDREFELVFRLEMSIRRCGAWRPYVGRLFSRAYRAIGKCLTLTTGLPLITEIIEILRRATEGKGDDML